MSEKGGKDFAEMVGAMREVFNTGRTKTKMWRESQLRSLLELLANEAPAICQALKKDLNKVRLVVNRNSRAVVNHQSAIACRLIPPFIMEYKSRQMYVAYLRSFVIKQIAHRRFLLMN